jgi:hypothetical protein
MAATNPRPRTVEVAFWSWLAGAVLLIVGGLFSVTISFDTVRSSAASSVSNDQLRSFLTFYRGVGVICVLLGLAIGYLAGRTRRGDKRFRRAAVALSLASVVLLAVAALLIGLPLPALLATVLLIIGAGTITRPTASAWFDAQEQPGSGSE